MAIPNKISPLLQLIKNGWAKPLLILSLLISWLYEVQISPKSPLVLIRIPTYLFLSPTATTKILFLVTVKAGIMHVLVNTTDFVLSGSIISTSFGNIKPIPRECLEDKAKMPAIIIIAKGIKKISFSHKIASKKYNIYKMHSKIERFLPKLILRNLKPK